MRAVGTTLWSMVALALVVIMLPCVADADPGADEYPSSKSDVTAYADAIHSRILHMQGLPAPRIVESRRLTHNIGNRHSSVHLTYPQPDDGQNPTTAWYNTIVPIKSSSANYFSVLGHQFGYFGLQQVEKNPFRGRVLFSLWDQGCPGLDDPNACPESERSVITECGSDPQVTCTRFGWEGSGAKSYFEFDDWKIGETYTFALLAFKIEGGGREKARYEGYFHAKELGGWVLLSKIVILTGSRPWHIQGFYSFVEQWVEKDGRDERRVNVGPAFARTTRWIQMNEATFSYPTDEDIIRLNNGEDNSHNDAGITAGGDQWTFAHGGNLPQSQNQKRLKVNPASMCPAQLAVFDELSATDALPKGASPKSCGGHYAFRCADCGGKNNCNGDCEWQSNPSWWEFWKPGTCVDRPGAVGGGGGGEGGGGEDRSVSCGGHSAASCAQCGTHAGWCNGECEWNSGTCRERTGGRRLQLVHAIEGDKAVCSSSHNFIWTSLWNNSRVSSDDVLISCAPPFHRCGVLLLALSLMLKRNL